MREVYKVIYLVIAFQICSVGLSNAVELSFGHNAYEVVSIEPEASTGLEKIYVLHDLSGVEMSYMPQSDGANVEWSRFDESGGGYAVPVTGVTFDGMKYMLQNPEGNCGYIINENNRQYCFWLVDYSRYQFSINSISFPDMQDCGVATLEVDAQCEPIMFYTINGVPQELDRQIMISYNTLEWDEENLLYNQKEVELSYENISERVVLTAPLCNTEFIISGDRFLKEWNEERSLVSGTYETISIEIQATATQTIRENDNEQKDESSELGGSAPVEIEFQSYCTDAVAHKEWMIARDAEFTDVDLRLNEDDITHIFQENGTFYVKFVGSNADGTCVTESEVFQVSVGESVLDCPNAFSPNATEGVNDEWKVSYKSIVSFSCWIFDRYGNQMCSFTDPAMGWDGKYKGKFVKPGVYYYVIEALGADGKEYKLKGDINILKSSK